MKSIEKRYDHCSTQDWELVLEWVKNRTNRLLEIEDEQIIRFDKKVPLQSISLIFLQEGLFIYLLHLYLTSEKLSYYCLYLLFSLNFFSQTHLNFTLPHSDAFIFFTYQWNLCTVLSRCWWHPVMLIWSLSAKEDWRVELIWRLLQSLLATMIIKRRRE